MTALQKLMLRASEIRQRLNEIAGLEGDALTPEIRAESDRLTNEFRDVETRTRAATVASTEPDPIPAPAGAPETRERSELESRANLGAIFAAAIEHRSTEGAEAELQTELGLNANQVPLSMLRMPVETRAVTPAPSDTGASQQPIVQPVFAEGVAAFLGVDMPSVPVGDAVFSVLTSRPTVGGPHTDSTSVGETTGAFTADALAPHRIQASFFYRRTDAARFAGMSEALRTALGSGLSEAMDQEIIDRIVSDVARTNAAAVNTFETYRSKLIYGEIDGRYASMESDIRLLVGGKTLAHMAGQYRSNNADDSAADSIRRVGGGIRVSALIAAVSGNKQDAIVRRGMRRDAVAPMWEGVTLIPDEVTGAKNGEITITAVLLAAWKVIRTGGFKRIQTQHA